MRIISLEAENVKRLRCVAITPAGNVVEVTGPNGSGKSSVLDSIWYALGGTADIPEVPVRRGASKAQVTLDLGEIKVTRSFSTSGTTNLRVESKSGEKLSSPQKILDSLVGSLTFDPLAFSRMKAGQQLEELKKLVKLDLDVDELDRQNEADYSARTEVNREIKSQEARIASIVIPEGTPGAPVDIAGLVEQLEAVGAKNLERQKVISEAERKRDAAKTKYRDAESCANKCESAEAEIKHLKERIKELSSIAKEERENGKRLISEGESMESEAASIVIPDVADSAPLKSEIEQARRINEAVGRRKSKESLSEEIRKLEKRSNHLTRQIEGREEQKRHAIESAKMPVPGLSFGNGQVLLNGLPFSQSSSAEQLRVSTAMAMAANPKLRIIRIQDGSLLDSDGMKILDGMAEQNNFQVWIERVSGSTSSAVVMEAGEIKSRQEGQ